MNVGFGKNKIFLIVVFGSFFLCFFPIYPELFSTWLNSSDDSHGILVPVITVYLIWQRRESLAKASTGSWGWGGIILLASLALHVAGYAGSVSVVSRLMIVTGLIGLVLFNFGKRFFALIAFPLCYLIFIVPVPVSIYSLLAFPLQLFASQISAFLIAGSGIPVLREGNMLYFAQTQLEVAEACSGLRSMTSFIMLSCLFGYMMKAGWGRRITIFLSAIPLALLANIVRVTGTGILAHFIGGKAAQGFLHEFSGMVVFAFGFLLLLGEYWLLEHTGAKTAE